MHLEMNGSLYVPLTTKYVYPSQSGSAAILPRCFAVFIILILFIRIIRIHLCDSTNNRIMTLATMTTSEQICWSCEQKSLFYWLIFNGIRHSQKSNQLKKEVCSVRYESFGFVVDRLIEIGLDFWGQCWLLIFGSLKKKKTYLKEPFVAFLCYILIMIKIHLKNQLVGALWWTKYVMVALFQLEYRMLSLLPACHIIYPLHWDLMHVYYVFFLPQSVVSSPLIRQRQKTLFVFLHQ